MVSGPPGDVDGELSRLGPGELACIRLCDPGDLLLMDDRVAGEVARKNGVSVTSIPGLLLAVRRADIVSFDRILELTATLEDVDHYRFEDGFVQRLEDAGTEV